MGAEIGFVSLLHELPHHEETRVRGILVAARWADAKGLLGKHRQSCQRHSS